MSFINKWIDKVDGVDDVLADDVNLLATGIKEAIEKAEETVTFDGIIETDEIDEYEFPQKSGSYVYKLIDSLIPDDFGGILLVASYYNKRGSITYLAKMYQTKIIVSTGEILTRQTTHTTHIQPITWSEWESVYATQKHVENTVAELAKIEDELERQKIINTVEGEAIALPDSIEAPFRGLKVMGKTEQFTTTGAQLIKYPFAYSNGLEKNGITYTYADSVLSVSGTSTDAGSWFNFNNGVQLPAGDYTLSYVADSEADKSGAKFYVRDADANVVLTELNMGTTTKQKTFTLTEDNSNIRIYMTVTGTVTLKGQIKLQLQSGKTATQFEPYTGGVPAPNVDYPQPLVSVGDDGSVDVNVHGYQLFDASKIEGQDANGVTVTNNGDGSFAITGTSTAGFSITAGLSHKETIRLLKVGNITLSNNGVYGYPYAYIALFGTNGKYIEINTMSSKYETSTITQEMLDDELLYMRIGIYVKANDTTVTYLKPMLYQDGDGTWEPFKPIQTLSVPTPNGLPAVPVSANGNYTDASGQQWVCDEIDFNRGAYVERVYKYVNTGEKDIAYAPVKNDVVCCKFNTTKTLVTHSGMSNRFSGTSVWSEVEGKPYKIYNASNVIYISIKADDLGINGTETEKEVRAIANDWLANTFSADNPLIIYCGCAESTETPLSEEEIAAYKALHTHYPTTSIHNSENAHMAVDYVADTKNYVDNQIKKEVAELTAAILTQ